MNCEKLRWCIVDAIVKGADKKLLPLLHHLKEQNLIDTYQGNHL